MLSAILRPRHPDPGLVRLYICELSVFVSGPYKIFLCAGSIVVCRKGVCQLPKTSVAGEREHDLRQPELKPYTQEL